MTTVIGVDGRWLEVPPCFCALLGYTASELLALRLSDVTHPEDLARERATRARLLEGSASSVESEQRLVRKDGMPVWVYLNSTLVTAEDAAPLGFLTYVRDISSQRQLEEQLRRAHAIEAVGQLAGGVAHEFNNLLTAIFGYTAFLREACAGMSDAQRDLDHIHSAATSASVLTAQLLAFGRRQVLTPEVVSVNAAIARMTELLSRVVGESVTLTTQLGDDVPPVEVDRLQLQQVLVSLAANARDAMPEGGRLCVDTSSRLIDDASRGILPPGRYAAIVVSDTGCGMDHETQARIFEPFFTARNPGRRTGMGLATVYGFIKQSGGEITCDSAPGAGATFSILLPAAAASPDDGVDRLTSDGEATILVVEDRSDVRRLIRRILESRGYRVVDTDDAETAVRAAAEMRVDLLLTDVVMPRVSGPELARRVRARNPRLPVVLISGFSDDAAVTDLGAAAFLQKPFTPERLVEAVRAALEPGAGVG